MSNCKLCDKKFWLFFREYKDGLCQKCFKKLQAKSEWKNKKTINSSSRIFKEFIVLDFETTGLNEIEDKIIEIAAIKYKDKQPIDKFNTLVNPGINIPHRITKLTGINNNDVKNKPTINKCIKQLIDFIGDLPIVAHNATFDINFLLANSYYVKKQIKSKYKIDTLTLSRKIFKDLPNHKLETIAEHLNLDVKSHRALNDCKVCAKIYLKYCDLKEQELIEEKKFREKMYSKCVIDPNKCLNVIIDILSMNNKPLDLLQTSYTGNYFDIKMFFNFLRLKLNGKKHYMILKIPKRNFMNNYPNEKIEDTTKSETGKSRVYISCEKDLYKFDKLILKQFDITINELEYFKKHDNRATKYLDEYLSNK